MRKFFLISMILTICFSSAQEKYYIKFKDKGPDKELSKSSVLYKRVMENLSQKAIERRQKLLGDEIVGYEDIPVNSDYTEILKKMGIKIENRLNWFNSVTSYLTAEQIKSLKSLEFISGIEKVNVYKLPAESPLIDELNNHGIYKNNSYKYDYGVSSTQMLLSDVPKVHDLGYSGQNVYLGLLDSGFKWKNNLSLSERKVIYEYDFVENDAITENKPNDLSSQHNHGTAVFSICAGFLEGSLIGPAFDASFLLAKTEDVATEKNIEEDNYAAALEWMEAKGVDIVSSSLGYSTFDAGQVSYTYQNMDGKTAIVTKASAIAFSKGVLTITSAGNEGNKTWKYISAPGDEFNIITVGALDKFNAVAAFSSYGPTSDGRLKPEVSAMGVGVYHITPAGTVTYGNGTSYSAPIVAGIAAQLLSAFPHLTNTQMRSILINACDTKNTPDNRRGYGLVSSLQAVLYPNLEKTSAGYKIHKIISTDPVNNELKLYYKKNTSSSFSNKLMTGSNKKFSAEVTGFNTGDIINFYFEYKDQNNNLVREPKDTLYTMQYGNLILTSVNDQDESENMPTKYSLSQNYPNPFNPGTTIEYKIPEAGIVMLKVYNLLGQEITTLVNEYKSAGKHSVSFSFNSSNSTSGTTLTSGVYFYRLTAGSSNGSERSYTETKKMVLLK